MESNGSVTGINILVIDDNEDIRETVEVMSRSGYGCERAQNEVEAMQRVRQRRFDAVVTDLEMPEMDGIALSGLPVMIMTGHSDEDHREIAFRAGAREVVGKPFGIQDFMTRLERVLRVQEPTLEQRV